MFLVVFKCFSNCECVFLQAASSHCEECQVQVCCIQVNIVRKTRLSAPNYLLWLFRHCLPPSPSPLPPLTTRQKTSACQWRYEIISTILFLRSLLHKIPKRDTLGHVQILLSTGSIFNEKIGRVGPCSVLLVHSMQFLRSCGDSSMQKLLSRSYNTS